MATILLLGLTSFFTDVSSEMVYPLIPLWLTARLGAGPAVLGLIEGVAESLASLLKVVAGRLSDRLGHRKALAIAGYGTSAAGKVVLATATGWGGVFASRVVDRFGKGVRTAPRDALIADSVAGDRHGLAFGVQRALDTLGAVTGAGIAWLLLTRAQADDYGAAFRWAIVPAALGAALLLLVRERRAARPRAVEPLEAPRWSALPAKLRRVLGVVLVFTLGNSSNAFILLRARSLGFEAPAVVLLYVAYNAVYAAASLPAGWLSDRVGRRRILVAGYACYALVYLALAAVQRPEHAAWLWPILALYGLYSGLTDGVERALVVDLAPRTHRATVLGLHATIVGLGLFPASFVAGQLWEALGPASVFLLGGATGAVAALGLLLVL